MDEFVKATSAQKKILEVLSSLKPFEEIVIRADKDGKFDTFWVKRESKFIVVAEIVKFTR